MFVQNKLCLFMIFFSLWGVIFPKKLKVIAQVIQSSFTNEKQQPPKVY